MPIVTLTTDWGVRDHYLAAFKGELLSRSAAVRLIDISHEVKPSDFLQASFVIKNCFKKFPEGTLHFIGVSGNARQINKNDKRNFLIVKSCGHYFLGEDSGIFSLILGDEQKEIYQLPVLPDSSPIEVYDYFLSVISSFADSKKIEDLGQQVIDFLQSFHAQPTVDQAGIRGSVVYIDSVGNLISNINKDLFYSFGNNRKFIISLRKADLNIESISKNYFDVEAGEIVAIFNQDDYLEIAMNHDSAERMLNMKLMDTIRIDFM